MLGKVSTLAMRTASGLCRRNIHCNVTFLDVHAASGHEAACDGSFHARRQMLLQRYGAIPSAPPHDVLLLAKVQREYHSSYLSALVADA